VGILDYWNVVPMDVDERTGRQFYERPHMTVRVTDVLDILRLRRLAA